MNPSFPTAERNALLKRLAKDPRWHRKNQERPKPPLVPPTKFQRVAQGRNNWGLPRTLSNYVVTQDTTIGGKATKWVVRGTSGPDDFYIAKFGNKNGRVEIFTELFNNQLGSALGLEMAHSGVARLDGHLYFVTRNFRRSEGLIHGSLLVEDCFGAKDQLDSISPRSEQAFYSINFVVDVIRQYCGKSSDHVLEKFFEMLVFDALIGSMDRHAKNWGVLRSEFAQTVGGEELTFRLAPIFDSARALLWDLPEGKLLLLDHDESSLLAYVESSRPCIGPDPGHPKINDCNHFEFMECLLELYPHLTKRAFAKIPVEVCEIAGKVLNEFPFNRAFSSLRKRLILKVLNIRADMLRERFLKGGTNDNVAEITHEIQRTTAQHSVAL